MVERSRRGISGHDQHHATTRDVDAEPATRRNEIAMFLLLAVVIWPFVTVAVVGGYGFLVWMTQLVLGPPGPPPV